MSVLASILQAVGLAGLVAAGFLWTSAAGVASASLVILLAGVLLARQGEA